MTLHLPGVSKTGDQLIKAELKLQASQEVYFSFPRPGAGVLQELANIVSLCDLTVDSVYAYANPAEFVLFLEKDLPFKVLRHPGDVDFDLNMLCRDELLQRDLTEGWDFYPTFEGYVALMYQFEQDFPDLVEIVEIGESVLGRELLFARISPNVQTRRPVPQFMYTSTMHGDETAGFILSLRLIHYLLTHYGEDDAITGLMDQVEIWICPNENPDGTYRHDNSTVAGATRGNINGVDLNRNYPNPVNDPWQTQQVETTAMIHFTDTMNFIMSANMHGGIELVNFPFDSWTSSVNTHADHHWWEFVMYEYVDTVHAYAPPGYMTGMGDGVTHGGDWYVIYGSRQDYFNYYKSCREFTLELSNIKLLPPHLLPDHWDWNYRSLLNYIRQSTFGVHGLVYDNQTGEPLLAELSIPSYDSDGSEVRTALPHGNYNRPLLAGTYDLRFEADGYAALDVPGVVVENHHTTRLNVGLGDGVSGTLAEVSIGTEGEGRVLPFEGTQWFTVGSNVFLSAEPADGWDFVRWIIDGTEYEEANLVYPLNGDAGITAVFTESQPKPTIMIYPGNIAFGVCLVGIAHGRELTVYNAGNETLIIYSLDVSGDEVFYLELPSFLDGFTLEPGQEETLDVFFEPQEEMDYTAEIQIISNDPDASELGVSLTGSGILEAAIIRLLPHSLDFGEVHLGESSSLELLLVNEGNLALTIQDIEQDGQGHFVVQHPELPIILNPDDDLNIAVIFEPGAAGVLEGEAVFFSNADNQSQLLLSMTGQGIDPTSVSDTEGLEFHFVVYPNPLSWNSVLLLTLERQKDMHIGLRDLHGRMVLGLHSGPVEAGKQYFSLAEAIGSLPPGIYFLTIDSPGSRHVQGVVVP